VRADADYEVYNLSRRPNCVCAVRTFEGVGTVRTLDGREACVPAGSLLLVDRGELVRHNTARAPWPFWWCVFDPTEGFGLPLNEVFEVPGTAHEELLFYRAFRELRLPSVAHQMYAAATFQALLWHWLSSRAGTPAALRSPRPIAAMVEYMHAHLGMPWSAPDLAASVGLSLRQTHRIFREATGRSIKRYYMEMRLEMAREYLEQGRTSVTDLAYRLGFSSPFHFSRAFSKEYGMPPSSVRRHIMAEHDG
jgi:AraC-like DNA-binding protein